MKSYIAFTFYLLFIYCNIHSGIHSQELDLDSPHDMPKEVMDTVNTIKEKVKDIKKPEDIPQNSPNRIMDCISKYINYKKLKVEIDDSIKRGDLDLVFQKYCGSSAISFGFYLFRKWRSNSIRYSMSSEHKR
ncbi:hypothetical protein Anas_04849, partial [Armadillidium nasatum]